MELGMWQQAPRWMYWTVQLQQALSHIQIDHARQQHRAHSQHTAHSTEHRASSQQSTASQCVVHVSCSHCCLLRSERWLWVDRMIGWSDPESNYRTEFWSNFRCQSLYFDGVPVDYVQYSSTCLLCLLSYECNTLTLDSVLSKWCLHAWPLENFCCSAVHCGYLMSASNWVTS